jgi:hypothetical protein
MTRGYQNFKASIFLTPQELEALGFEIRDGKLVNFDEWKYDNVKQVIDEEFYCYWVPANKYLVSTDYLRVKVILTSIEQPQKNYIKRRPVKGFKNFKRWGSTQRFTCGIFRYSTCKGCKKGFLQRVPCKREWCPECGRENSLAHKYQKMRMWPYVLELYEEKGSVGYFVITTPEYLRKRLINKKERYKFRRYIEYLFKKEGYEKGLSRWHFAGDESKKWYPHLNVLIAEDYIEPEKLERIKKKLERKYGIKDIFYEYITTLPRLNFVVNYISRSTFNLQNEVDYTAIKGTRKLNTWGKFKVSKLDKKSKEEFARYVNELMAKRYLETENERKVYCILSSRCPECYDELKWTVGKFLDLPGYQRVYKLGYGCWIFEFDKESVSPLAQDNFDVRSPPEEDYWEPGMGDLDYITEEDIKKALKEIEEKKK